MLNPEHALLQQCLICYCLFQHGLYHTDAVDIGDLPPEADSPQWVGLNQVPPTPAFPVTPPTPYGKTDNVFDVCYVCKPFTILLSCVTIIALLCARL